jgi:peptidoglycan/xylan/chitin deacetylase (PgdA/CDA1 family)
MLAVGAFEHATPGKRRPDAERGVDPDRAQRANSVAAAAIRVGRMKLPEGVKELAAVILCMVGAAALSRRLQRRRLAILMFHGIEAEPLSPHCEYVLDAATLRRRLEYVSRCFHVLPLEQALQQLYAGTLPDRAAAITFDDGTRNLLTHAAPVLRDLRLPAAVFLATGPMGTDETLWPDRLWLAFARTNASEADLTVLGLGAVSLRSPAERGAACAMAVERLKEMPDGQRMASVESLIAVLAPAGDGDGGPFRMLSWDEARRLADQVNVSLYPHSVTHPILSRCPDEKVEHEVFESCAALERETGLAPKIFAYPNGRPQDFDGRSGSALRRRGIRWALTTTYGFARRDCDPLALPRIGTGAGQSFARFRFIVSGAVWSPPLAWRTNRHRQLTRFPRRRPVPVMTARIIHIVLTLVLAVGYFSSHATAGSSPVFDDFDGPAGSAPNPAYWSYLTGTGADDGVESYITANAFLDGDSHVVIQAVKTGNGYTSGEIRTKNKLSLGYGTITARIKMPSGQGLWPAFFLVGADEDTTPWPHCGEIDIIELVSNATTYYSTLHGPISGNPNTVTATQQAQFTGPIADLSTEYHNYWVTHLADLITVGIDDETLGVFTPASLPETAQWVYNRPMYAILALAVGGDWAGPPDSSTPFPATMLVDRFRWDPV